MRRNKNSFYRWECPECDYALESIVNWGVVNKDLLINHLPLCKHCEVEMVRVLPDYDPIERERKIKEFWSHGRRKNEISKGATREG